MEALDSVVLHFFVAPSGELRCRATDLQTRRTWIVACAREVRDLLHAAPAQTIEKDEHRYER